MHKYITHLNQQRFFPAMSNNVQCLWFGSPVFSASIHETLAWQLWSRVNSQTLLGYGWCWFTGYSKTWGVQEIWNTVKKLFQKSKAFLKYGYWLPNPQCYFAHPMDQISCCWRNWVFCFLVVFLRDVIIPVGDWIIAPSYSCSPCIHVLCHMILQYIFPHLIDVGLAFG